MTNHIDPNLPTELTSEDVKQLMEMPWTLAPRPDVGRQLDPTTGRITDVHPFYSFALSERPRIALFDLLSNPVLLRHLIATRNRVVSASKDETSVLAKLRGMQLSPTIDKRLENQTIRMDSDDIATLDQVASHLHMSKSEVIRRLLQDKLDALREELSSNCGV